MLTRIEIEDDLAEQQSGAIEVRVYLSDGRRRWCFFMTPEALAACGDWIDGTTVRFHYGAPHMVVVAGVLTAALIEQALKHIDGLGELEAATLPLD